MTNVNLKQLVGITKADFDALVRAKKIKLRRARLIPFINPGKEEALTSILLSSLTLIDEFRADVLSAVGLPECRTKPKIQVYTEVVFPKDKDTEEARLDGLILVISGKKITNAAILEVKNGNDIIDKGQIERYLAIAKSLKIPKLITVSNEFVTEPSQSPLKNIKVPKGVELRHLSWQFIRALARIRLYDNNTNIEDPDQVQIMKEVVHYMEHVKSGVNEFNQMKQGWKVIAEKVSSQTTIQGDSPELVETVESWVQEERDMALKLSCNLGSLVTTDSRRFKGDIQKRMEHDSKELLSENTLSSYLDVESLASKITVIANFATKTVEMAVTLKPKQAKTIKGQLGWIKQQVENRELMKLIESSSSGKSILEDLYVELRLSNTRGKQRYKYSELEMLRDDTGMKNKAITEVSIIYHETFGRHFSSPRKFVERIENMLPKFYKEVAQHLKSWDQPPPKLTREKREVSEDGSQFYIMPED